MHAYMCVYIYIYIHISDPERLPLSFSTSAAEGTSPSKRCPLIRDFKFPCIRDFLLKEFPYIRDFPL